MSKKNDKKVAKTKAVEAPTKGSELATKLYDHVKNTEGVEEKVVDNGIGLWVKNTRVMKVGKSFPKDMLLFPRPDIRDVVNSKKVEGVISTKNVAHIKINEKNYDILLKAMDAVVEDAKTINAARAEKKSKAKKKDEAKDKTERVTKKAEVAANTTAHAAKTAMLDE